MNRRPRRSIPMHADDHWMHVNWYEAPREDPAWPEVYTYTDAMSYVPGDEVRFVPGRRACQACRQRREHKPAAGIARRLRPTT
jgi:hypothetical protein